ncbi:hypothetical protein BC567DRAFT_236337 [Phyllosticta citribraziliensis]
MAAGWRARPSIAGSLGSASHSPPIAPCRFTTVLMRAPTVRSSPWSGPPGDSRARKSQEQRPTRETLRPYASGATTTGKKCPPSQRAGCACA